MNWYTRDLLNVFYPSCRWSFNTSSTNVSCNHHTPVSIQHLIPTPSLKTTTIAQSLQLSAPTSSKKAETRHQSLLQEITARQLIVSAPEVKTTVGHTLALSTCIEMTRASLSQPRPQVYSPPLEISLQTCFRGPSNGCRRFRETAPKQLLKILSFAYCSIP